MHMATNPNLHKLLEVPVTEVFSLHKEGTARQGIAPTNTGLESTHSKNTQMANHLFNGF